MDRQTLESAFLGKEIISLPESHRITQNFLYLMDSIYSVSEADFSEILPVIATDIIFLIKNHVSASCTMPCILPPLALSVISYIDAHYVDPLDLHTLSETFRFSASSLCHVFKESFGISIKQYIQQKRLTAAHAALLQGHSPEAVCSICGFTDCSAFYRAYKKYFHFSPSKACTNK